ncbi:lysozyme [Bradyrhizobium sp. 613_E4_N2_2]|uniref:lysozyme n=1 Tax=Bradyrhizobium sp. 613_E4_N2_2 TaxID=3240371 RepID=UPI003F890A8F
MNPSAHCYAMAEAFEGRYLAAYRCPAGKLTIGMGHTGVDVKPGMTITNAEADRLLRVDMQSAALSVSKLVRVPLSQNMFDALCDFAFNLGRAALAGSTLLRKLNDGDYSGAAAEFAKWNKAHVNGVLVELDGLTKRRHAEAELFKAAA